MMLGAYLFYMFHVEAGLGLLTSGVLTSLLCVVVSIVTLDLFVLPFLRYSFILVIVTTLALSNILESLVSIAFGVNVKSLYTGEILESIQIGSVFITPIQIIIIISAIIILSFFAYIVHSTPVGRRIRALSENVHAAQSLGVSRRKTSYMVFTVAVLLASLAGILIGYETSIQPTMGHSYTIKSFAAMLLGGLGNLWGTIAGSFILGLIENLSIGLDFWGYSLPAGYKDAFAFSIILLVLLFRPEGIFNKKGRAV